MKHTGSPFVDKGKLKTFLKDPMLKELRNYSTWQNQLREMMGLLTGHCHFKGHLFRVGLVTVLGVTDGNRHLEHPHMFFITEALAVL